MGRKGVSKRKKTKDKEKAAPETAGGTISGLRKAQNTPDRVVEKSKAWSKDSKKR
jgi:hypothetical protein